MRVCVCVCLCMCVRVCVCMHACTCVCFMCVCGRVVCEGGTEATFAEEGFRTERGSYYSSCTKCALSDQETGGCTSVCKGVHVLYMSARNSA